MNPEKTPLEAWIKLRFGLAPEDPFTREILEKHQLACFKMILGRVKKQSRFYKKKLTDFSADDFSHVSDLAKLPLTDFKDIANDPYAFSCVSQSEISRVMTVSTSGTTGNPKKIFYTKDDQEATIDFFHHGMSCVTEPGSHVLIMLPGELPGSVGDLLQKGLVRLGAKGIHHGFFEDPLKTLEVISQNNIDCIVGFPVQILNLAAHPQSLDYTKDGIRSVLLVSDYVPDSLMNRVKELWNCETYCHYGMTETGLGGGVQCKAHQGYHMREADLLYEIIDPETRSPVKDGEYGEVVFTSLTAQGTPLIRYRTGDISCFLPEPCTCGTILKSMAKIRGRIMGGIMTGVGRIELRELDEVLFRLKEILDFRVEFRNWHGKDIFELDIYAPHTKTDINEFVEKAVTEIPVLRNCLEARRLEVRIAVSKQWINTGAAKRTMRDLRK
ncbi:MAG: AMP-binding protein [Spirochaetes bacterium]|nr:AMP-binding protein [Spirochaetota bacterium]